MEMIFKKKKKMHLNLTLTFLAASPSFLSAGNGMRRYPQLLTANLQTPFIMCCPELVA